MSETKAPRYRDAVQDMLDSWVWELVNHVQNRIPDPVDYIEMRRDTFGSGLGQILSEPESGDIPPEIFRTRPMRALANSASDATMLMNDIVSYRKEIELEGELNNGVLVVQNFLDCDLQQAVNVVNDLRTARLRQFEHVKATELPALFDQFGLDRARPEGAHGVRDEPRGLGCPVSSGGIWRPAATSTQPPAPCPAGRETVRPARPASAPRRRASPPRIELPRPRTLARIRTFYGRQVTDAVLTLSLRYSPILGPASFALIRETRCPRASSRRPTSQERL